MLKSAYRKVRRLAGAKDPAPEWPHTLAEVTVMDADRLRPMCIESDELPGSRDFAADHEKFRIRMAGVDTTRADASLLIEKMYAWRGYAGRVDLGDVPNRITLNAEYRGRIFGTLTVNIDSRMGLAAEEVFPEEVRALRREGRRLCEFGKFAVEQSVRSKRLLANLFQLTYIYAGRLNLCTDALIEVNPRHVAFYERYMNFRVWSEERLCPRVDAPAVLMRLDFNWVRQKAAELGGRWRELPEEKTFYKYFMTLTQEDGIVERLLRRAERRRQNATTETT